MQTRFNLQKETHLRSLSKSISWRVFATLTTIVIAYAVTGALDQTLIIGGVEFFAKFLIYYVHERLWASL
ncbi:MAG TPA: hypothetical protein DER02_01195 [Gammaproteobacteria bacterium]|nr:hypothetical protein [Gammaproteobacteria bacterium]